MKNTLSKCFKELLDDNGQTIYGLAEILEIERTQLQKFFSGSRNLSRENFKILVDYFKPDQEKLYELLTLFEIESQGLYRYNEHYKFMDLLQTLSSFQDSKKDFLKSTRLPLNYEIEKLPLQFVEGNTQVISVIENLLFKEMQREQEAHVILSLRENYDLLNELLLRMDYMDLTGGVVQNLIPIVNNKKLENNLEALETAFMLGCLKNIKFEPYYYYTASKKGTDLSILMPNYFITSSNLLLIDDDLKSAVIVDRPEVIDYYKNKATSIIRQSQSLINRVETQCPINARACFIHEDENKKREYMIAQKAIDFLKEKDPENKMARRSLYEQILPDGENEPSVFLLRDQFISGKNSIVFKYNEESMDFEIIFECHHAKKIAGIRINEFGINKAFNEFVRHLPESVYIYSREEIEKWFKKAP
ncbi:helix-turn-helix transcriptional regulator [Eubacteriaceae bacterium ES3]|nr:helix-turn-helix transcriptional regulator [Eubacteriaceae bacterium ES3]